MSRQLEIISPTRVNLIGFDKEPFLRQLLTYSDNRQDHLIKKWKNRKAYGWFIRQNGEEAYQEKIKELQAKKIQCLLFNDNGQLWTYSGLVEYLMDKYPDTTLVNNVIYPFPQSLPWDHIPEHSLRVYQEDAITALLAAKHGAISYATGSGKSKVVLHLIKRLGLKTLLVVPSLSIADQMYKEAVHMFGKKHVGKFYSGKKESNKLIVIGVAQSLIRVEEGDEHFATLSRSSVLIVDESHKIASDTLSQIALTLASNCQFRYFVSGTQLRNDGLDFLLRAIIGPIVKTLSVQDLVAEGYLAKPSFRMFKISSDVNSRTDDPNEYTRIHLYYNKRVNELAGKLANKCADEGKPTLILIDEIGQFSQILPYLTHKVRFAHGPLTAENKSSVPKEHQNGTPNELIEQFNNNEFPILVGTSAVSIGSDIRAVKSIIFIRGGKSEIDVKQSVGRGTRIVPGKSEFTFYDFDVIVNNNYSCTTHRHAIQRAAIYKEIYNDFKEISLLHD